MIGKIYSLAVSLVLVIFVWVVPGMFEVVNAQSHENSVSIGVSARIVESSIDLVTIQEMQPENVQPSQGEIFIDPIANASAGLLKAEGSSNSPVRITFQRQLELRHAEGSSDLLFTYEVSGNTTDNQSASELLNEDSRDLQLNEEGEYFIWVGGRVNIENAENGRYEGEFTVEMEYL